MVIFLWHEQLLSSGARRFGKMHHLEVNEQSPVVYGIGADHIHISDVDYIVESDAPIKTAPSRPAGEIDKK